MPRWSPYTLESLMANTVRVGSCLEWQGARDGEGYGRTQQRGKVWMANRLSWVLSHGPIPAGLEVCHRCDNPPCVNPEHLFLGTHQDNMRDAIAKGRFKIAGLPGVTNLSAKLNDEQVREIRALAEQGVSQRTLARRFGVTQSTVWRIVRRHKWTHVA